MCPLENTCLLAEIGWSTENCSLAKFLLGKHVFAEKWAQDFLLTMAPSCPQFSVICYDVITILEHYFLSLEPLATGSLAKTMELVGFQSLPVLCVGVPADGRVGVGKRHGKRGEGGFIFIGVLCKFLWFIAKRVYFKTSWWINNAVYRKISGKIPSVFTLLYFYYKFDLVPEKVRSLHDIKNKSWKNEKRVHIQVTICLANVVTAMAWVLFWN